MASSSSERESGTSEIQILCGIHGASSESESEVKKEDDILRNMLVLSSQTLKPEKDNEPTILSLQNTVDFIEKKYGKNWRSYPHCVMTVIWSSRLFLEDHVKEVVPDLYDLCMEYRDEGTVNGHEMDEMSILAFAVVDPNYPKIEEE